MISTEPCQITIFLYAPSFMYENQDKYAMRKKKGKKGRREGRIAILLLVMMLN